MKLIEANPRRPEKGTNKLRPIKELIKGGIADGMSDELFDSVELEKGIKVELEHTDDEMIAKEIAKDHLAEDPEYYKKLSKIHIEKNPHSTVGEFYTNLYMVSYTKKVKKDGYEANMVFDNRDNTFEVNVIKLPNYVATTKRFSTDDLGKFNLEAKKYFTDFEVDRFHKEVQKYLNDEVIKGLKGKNPKKKNPVKKVANMRSTYIMYGLIGDVACAFDLNPRNTDRFFLLVGKNEKKNIPRDLFFTFTLDEENDFCTECSHYGISNEEYQEFIALVNQNR